MADRLRSRPHDATEMHPDPEAAIVFYHRPDSQRSLKLNCQLSRTDELPEMKTPVHRFSVQSWRLLSVSRALPVTIPHFSHQTQNRMVRCVFELPQKFRKQLRSMANKALQFFGDLAGHGQQDVRVSHQILCQQTIIVFRRRWLLTPFNLAQYDGSMPTRLATCRTENRASLARSASRTFRR